jgi:hypothetical protein
LLLRDIMLKSCNMRESQMTLKNGENMEETLYPNINRAALVLKLKKPFCDWVGYISKDDEEPQLKSDQIETEGFDSKTVYLLPAFDYNEEFDRFLKENSEEIFKQQLAGWSTDPAVWPKDLSWKTFNKWFDYEIHTMVHDTIPDDSMEYED